MTFWNINTGGTDSLALWISYDAGATFTYLTKYLSIAGWVERTLDLGTSTAPNVILRFRGTSNAGGSDLGLDEISIFLAPQNDAGIAAINSPAAVFFTAVDTVKVSLKTLAEMT